MLPWISHNFDSKRKTSRFFFVGLVFLFLLGIFFIPHVAFAQNTTDTLGIDTIDKSNLLLAGTDIRIIIVKIINVILSFLGVLTLGLVLYSGYLWMTAGGDDAKVEQARKILINAVIGLVIIMSAWAITKFIINALSDANGINVSGEEPIALGSFGGSGGLGKVIRDHYPFVNQRDVARNTSIVITFATPVEPSSFVENTNGTCTDSNGEIAICDETHTKPFYGDCLDSDDLGEDINIREECDQLVTSTIAIFELADGDIDLSDVKALATTTPDRFISAAALLKYEVATGTTGIADSVYTIVLKPNSNYNTERQSNFLGNPEKNTWHGVYLTSNIKKKNSTDSLFKGQFSDHYYWKFEVSTVLDLEPPTVVSVSPQAVAPASFAEATSVPKNTIIQIQYSEPVDPIVTTGQVVHGNTDSGFSHEIVNLDGTLVSGTWRISNGYRTVEFVPSTPCGQNSCGDTMYCMPVTCDAGQSCEKPVGVLLRTGVSALNAEAPFEVAFDSGVYDLAQNGLSVNKDNKLDTHGKSNIYIITDDQKDPDNYYWLYKVNDTIDRTAPYIQRVKPGVDTEDIAEREEVAFYFSKMMRSYTFGGNITIDEYPANVCTNAALTDDHTTCPPPYGNLDDFGYVAHSRIEQNKTIAYIDAYRPYGPYDIDLYYYPAVTDDVMDDTQNCVYPGFGPSGEVDQGIDGDVCTVSFDADGNGTAGNGCISVTYSASADSGCAYKNTGGFGTATADKNTCIDTLKENSLSSYK